MNLRIKLIKNEQRKAVAPIIATLLMVAISVVGGILIFVFAQGFFKDTSIQSPTIDALEIFGYFAEDVLGSAFKIHTGEIHACGAGTVDQKVSDDECVGLFVRNVGSNPIIIENVKMFGVIHVGKTVAGTFPAKGLHCLIQVLLTGCTGNEIIQAGQEITILINNDKLNNGDIKIGRPIIIAVETGQGQVFTKQIRAGLSSGSSG